MLAGGSDGFVAPSASDETQAATELTRRAGRAARLPRQRQRVSTTTSAAPSPGTGTSTAFADLCRAWGFHVELLFSVMTGAGVVLVAEGSRAYVLFFLAVWVVCNFHRGRTLTSPLTVQLRRVVDSVLLPLALVAGCVGFLGVAPSTVPAVAVAICLSACVSGVLRVLRWTLQSPVRFVIVGDRVAIAQAAARWDDRQRVRAVGAILLEPDLDAEQVPTEILGVPVVAGLAATPAYVERWHADLVLVAPGPGLTAVDFRRLSWALERSRVSLGVLGVLDPVAPHRITPGVMNGVTVTDVRLPRASSYSRIAKATVDRVAGLVLLVLAAPVLALIFVAVRLDSRGPGLFTQERIGRNGRTFKVYKVRTMVAGADDLKAELADANECDSVLFKIKDDPRITRVGAFLRRTSLDELPQLVNVVRGEMSLVGPRPHLASELAELDTDSLRRLAVRPGLTGLWQVSGRSDLPFEKAAELDAYYADNWTLAGDATIVLRTVKAVVTGKGAY